MPPEEPKTISDRIGELEVDMTTIAVCATDALREDDAIEAVQESSHWDAIRRAIITDAIEHREVYSEDSYAEAAAGGEAAQTKYEEALADFECDVDRLHEMICQRRTTEACDLLRAMAPEHPFMSDAAQLMLAGIRGTQL